jgi:hypothetical protein
MKNFKPLKGIQAKRIKGPIKMNFKIVITLLIFSDSSSMVSSALAIVLTKLIMWMK